MYCICVGDILSIILQVSERQLQDLPPDTSLHHRFILEIKQGFKLMQVATVVTVVICG